MIEEYLRHIDELLSTSALVSDVDIVRRSIRDTELEKVLNYRYRVALADGGFVEMTERVLETQGTLEITKYRHHWQDRDGRLIRRWDNAPHYRDIDTFRITSMKGPRTTSSVIRRLPVLRLWSVFLRT
jgi:hypothetical protein